MESAGQVTDVFMKPQYLVKVCKDKPVQMKRPASESSGDVHRQQFSGLDNSQRPQTLFPSLPFCHSVTVGKRHYSFYPSLYSERSCELIETCFEIFG